MADPRYYAKLDVGYFDNPKTTELLEERPRVLVLHLRAITYCRQHLTDGTFPLRLVVRLACASYCGSQCGSQCDRICDVCMAVQSGLFINVNGKTAEVHDYLKHQDSVEAIEARKMAGKKGAAARWGDADGNAGRNADRNANANAKERRGEERSSTRASAREDDAFTTFYDLYPKKVGRGQAAKAHKAALKKADADTILGGLRRHLPIWERTERQFIPNPATWLNGERWTDDVDGAAEPDPLAHIPSVEELQRRRGF